MYQCGNKAYDALNSYHSVPIIKDRHKTTFITEFGWDKCRKLRITLPVKTVTLRDTFT